MARNKETAAQKTGVAAWNESEGSSPRSRKADGEKKRRIALLALLGAVCVACVVCMWPIKERITRGLWLKEGTAYTMTATTDEGEQPSASELSSAISVVARRLGTLDVSDAAVRQRGEDEFAVELPWFIKDGEQAAQTVGGKGLLEFVRMDEVGDADALALINAGAENVQMKAGTYTPFMDGSSITSATVTEVSSGIYAITLTFDEAGAQTFADVTRELAEDSGSIAIVMDGRVLSAPSVSEEISGGQVSISGVFSKSDAEAMKAVLDSGPLSLSTTYAGAEKVGALVGEGTKMAIVGIAVVAFVGVCVAAFMRYRKLAVVIGGAMLVYTLLMLALMALGSQANMFVLTMPGLIATALCCAATVCGAWRVCSQLVKDVESGMSYKGATLACVKDGLTPLKTPCILAFVASLVFVFLPVSMLRDFGTAVVMGVVCGVVTIVWYVITSVRLYAADAMQADPAAWGISAASTEDAKSEG